MSRYKAYAEYKDSGIAWLEKIPAHWGTSKVRYMFSLGKGLTITKENLQDEGVPCVNYGEVHSKFGFEIDPTVHALKCVSEQYLASFQDSLLLKGDLVFADTSEDVDGSGNFTQLISDQPVFAGYHTIIVRPNNRQSCRFYAYLFDSKELRTQIRHAVKGVKVFSITQAILRGTDIWLPSLAEREKIANFLDHETAKIDTLIAKQQELIKLLKEKRQAVISHAVTKGINPNAPLRDSGVEWLGDVPAHWEVCLIKFKCREITDGAHVSPTTEGGQHYFISITDVKKGVINFENALLTTTQSYEYLVKTGCKPFAGDILFSKDGTIGQTAITPGGIDFVVASSLIIIRPNLKKVTPQYLDFLLRSDVVGEQVESFVKGAALRRLSIQNLLKVGGAFPPIQEQAKITDYLSLALSHYDELESKANSMIQFQNERRTALISAAVTGKIDVRDWQPAQLPELDDTSV